jgi:GNAT superfamily N-acetyltransferase
VEFRPIAFEDLPACVDVFYAAEEELYGRLNIPPLPRNAALLERLFTHIRQTDPESCWLAEESGTTRAFGMAVKRGALHFLSFLFVEPEAQGRGLGRRLLERCLPSTGYRATCVEAVQPVSAALYAGQGLVPRTPIYTLVGQPRAALPRLPKGLQLESFAPAGARNGGGWASAVDAIDRRVLGFNRRADHGAWTSWQREGFLLRAADAGGTAVGYGYAHTSGRLGPAVVLERAHLLPLLGELMSCVTPLDAWQVLVPGSAADTFVGLLRAGLRLEGPPGLYCANRAGVDHSRYLPTTFALP